MCLAVSSLPQGKMVRIFNWSKESSRNSLSQREMQVMREEAFTSVASEVGSL